MDFPIFEIILVLIVVGVILWLINFLPLGAPIKQIITGLIVICVVLWLIVDVVMPLLGHHVGTPTRIFH